MKNRFKFRQRYEGSFHLWGWLGEGFTNPMAHLPSEQIAPFPDSGGGDIWEGDFIRYDEEQDPTPWEVKFCSLSGTWITESGHGVETLHEWLDTDGRVTAEVIGNIHDNPELLEGRS